MKFTDWAKDMIADLEADPESYESWFADLNDVLVRDTTRPLHSSILTNTDHITIRRSKLTH